jgi:hypothetical protein
VDGSELARAFQTPDDKQAALGIASTVARRIKYNKINR